ncbi:50S ribosomal protein L1 [Candidatus Micrarchaeota archaeon]|nr:50S ribosomal protein L1 [Candidatus Micrarchaeota archaeon]
MVDYKKILHSVNEVLKEKGKRKFVQTVDLAVNFKGIDFKKPENRINIDIVLPNGRGKEVDVVIFTDDPQKQLEANKLGAKVYSGEDIEKLGSDRKKLKELAKNAEFLADPKLMASVGKNLGRVLGVMNKLPRPLVGPVSVAIKNAKNRIRLSTRGKYLPVLHCPVGNENMSAEDITRNIEHVLEKLKSKVNDQNIKSMYVKLTMGKPVKI